jgi:3-phenylpropionate/trans-cinnamate dioxygenase ferredoxin reductase component
MRAAMVIVGGGQAGARAAHALRTEGWGGEITLVCAEEDLPYERPPLSKEVLLGTRRPDACLIHTPAFYEANNINVLLQTEAIEILRSEHRLVLSSGDSIPYQRLLLATGSRPRTLSIAGADTAGLITLRTMTDARRLGPLLTATKRCLLIGGGLIGLEVAATARQSGCDVTVVEAAPRLLERSVPAELAQRLKARHEEDGVHFIMNASIRRIDRVGEEISITLQDGVEIASDLAIAGIGAAPNTALAERSGLEVDDGIVVDSRLQTSDPDVFAAGDACRFLHPGLQRHIRLENWKNAEDQAPVAASNMLGKTVIYNPSPWFWSQQYDLLLQVAGFPGSASHVVKRIAPDNNFLILFHLADDGSIAGVSSLGRGTSAAKEMRIGQMLMEQHAKPSAFELSETTNLKSLLPASTRPRAVEA